MNKRRREKRPDNDDSTNYYKRVSDTLKEGFQTDEDKELFLNNVFSQLETEAADISKGQVTSHIVEELIVQCNPCHIELLMKSLLSADWLSLCCHRFGSHVIQTLIGVLPKVFISERNDISTKKSEDSKLFSEEIFLELLTPVLENMNDFLTDVYGSHVLRIILEVLGGKTVEEQILRSRASRNQKWKDNTKKIRFPDFESSDSFRILLKKCAEMIFNAPDLKVHLLNGTSNPVVQTVILVLNKSFPKKCQKYVRKIIELTGLFNITESGEETSSLPEIVKHDVGSFLVEQIIVISDISLQREFYSSLFKGRLLQFSTYPVANFILQRFLDNVTEKEIFEEMFPELIKHTEDILAVNCMGVISKMMEACLKFGCKQSEMLESLMEAFHCQEPIERQCKIVPLIGSLSTFEVFYNSDNTENSEKDTENKIALFREVNYHGAVLLQQLLKFDDPRLVVSSLLELKPVELKNLSCDQCGSHVIDVFYKSETVGEKNKQALLNRYKGILLELACTKNGSRTLEGIWKCLKTKHKIVVAEELARNIDKLHSDKFGHFVFYNFAIEHFRNRRDDWLQLQGEGVRKRKMFEDIFDDTKDTSCHPDDCSMANRMPTEAPSDIIRHMDQVRKTMKKTKRKKMMAVAVKEEMLVKEESVSDSFEEKEHRVKLPDKISKKKKDKKRETLPGSKHFHKKKSFKTKGKTLPSSKTFKIKKKKHKKTSEHQKRPKKS